MVKRVFVSLGIGLLVCGGGVPTAAVRIFLEIYRHSFELSRPLCVCPNTYCVLEGVGWGFGVGGEATLELSCVLRLGRDLEQIGRPGTSLVSPCHFIQQEEDAGDQPDCCLHVTGP